MTAAPTIHIDAPKPADHEAIRELLAIPMPGPVAFARRNEPDHRIAASAEGDVHHEIVARHPDHDPIVAYAARTVRTLWLRGEPTRIGYLTRLRIRPGLRSLPRILHAAFDALAETRTPDEAAFDFTSIMDDNVAARRLLERRLPHLPRYTPVGHLTTFVIRTRSDTCEPHQATDFDAITTILHRHDIDWNLRPAWTNEALRQLQSRHGLTNDDFIVQRNTSGHSSCAAIWDQRAFEQIAVSKYAPLIRRTRTVVNAASKLSGYPPLPPSNHTMKLGYLSHIAAPADDWPAFRSLVHEARSRAARRGLTHLTFALPRQHPWMARARRQWRAWSTGSTIYAVHHTTIRTLECARTWPEVAIL